MSKTDQTRIILPTSIPLPRNLINRFFVCDAKLGNKTDFITAKYIWMEPKTFVQFCKSWEGISTIAYWRTTKRDNCQQDNYKLLTIQLTTTVGQLLTGEQFQWNVVVNLLQLWFTQGAIRLGAVVGCIVGRIWQLFKTSGSQPFMVRGPLPKVLNTCAPLFINRVLRYHGKAI